MRNDYRPENDAESVSDLDPLERLMSDRVFVIAIIAALLCVIGSAFIPVPEPEPDCQVIIVTTPRATPTSGKEGGRLLQETSDNNQAALAIVTEKWYNRGNKNASDFGETRRFKKGHKTYDALCRYDFIMGALSSQEGGTMRRYIVNSRRTKPITEPELPADFIPVEARIWDFESLRLYWSRGGFTVRERGGSGYWSIPFGYDESGEPRLTIPEAELREALGPILADLREEIA